MLKQQHRFFLSVLGATDIALLVGAVPASYWLRFQVLVDAYPPKEAVWSYSTHALPILAIVPLMIAAMVWTRLYVPRRDQRFYREAGTILRAVGAGVLLTLAVTSLLRNPVFEGRDYSRLQLLIYAGLTTTSLLAWRFAFRAGLRWLRRRGWNLRHVAIIGTGRLGQVVGHTLRRNSWTGITASYHVSHHGNANKETCNDLPVLGGLNELESILDEHPVSGVFIAMPGRMTAELPELLTRLARFPIDVRVIPDMNPRYMPVNMTVNELDGMPILSVRESPLNQGWARIGKRVVDVIGALVALVIFSIPMLIITALVRRSGSGPVIFRQERMSLNGQHFNLFKFRTMQHVTAEEQVLRDAGQGTDAWTQRDDPRITPLGRFLRRTSLDELPQLFNVLLGEMSLVGPRPERPELIGRFREDWRGYMLRQNVKAGMTGWAQVNGLRGDTDLRKRLQYDLFYVRNWSLMFDVRILWMTLFKGFANPNAH